MNLAALLGLGIVVFASTNVDDIFILLGFFADRRFRARNVVLGQFVGIGALVIVSIVGSLVSLVLAPAYVGLLGALPILIGIKKLFELRRDHRNDEAEQAHEAGSGAFGQIISVAAVTIANGGDNIGVYTPILATHGAAQVSVIVVVFMAMTAIWLAAAHGLVNHRTIGAFIRRHGPLATPFVLIGLGLFILYDARSFELMRFAGVPSP